MGSPVLFSWEQPLERALSIYEKASYKKKLEQQASQKTKSKHQSHWEKADYCLIKRKSRARIEVATLIGHCPSIVDSYVKSAKTFPAEYRIPELNSFRSYEYLSRLSNPITILEFCLSYNLSSSELYSLYRFLKENPEEEKNLAKAAKRVGIKLGQPRTVIWGKSFDDASEITTENQVGQERPVNKYNTVNDLLAAMEENPEDYYVDLRIFNNKDLSAPIVDVNNFPELKTGRPPIPIPHQQFMGYYRKGLVDQDIAELLDTSRSTVLRYRQELGLPANREIGVRGPAKAKEVLTQIPTMIDSLRKENESLKKENQSLEEENQFLRDQIAKLLAEQADLGPILELQKTIDGLQVQNESLVKEIKRTKRLTETYLNELQRRTSPQKRVG